MLHPANSSKLTQHISFTPDHPLWDEAIQRYQSGGSRAACDFLREHGIPMTPAKWSNRMKNAGIHSTVIGRGQQWTPEDERILADLFPDPTVPLTHIADQIGRSVSAVKDAAKQRRIFRGVNVSPFPTVVLPHIPLTRPLLVLGDTHIPFQHKEWIDRCLRLAVAWGAEEAIIVGDIVDAQSMSRFERFTRPDAMDEIEAWVPFEEAMLRYLRHLHLSLGNHDFRWGKATDYRVPTAELIRRMFVRNQDRVTVHDSFAVDVGDDWRLEHPKGSSMNVALQLVGHHLKNVGVAHTHHTSQRRDPSGRYVGVEIGASCDHTRMPYCNRITHGSRRMTNGALILVPGKGRTLHYLIEPEHDLEAMARMYKPGLWKAMKERQAA